MTPNALDFSLDINILCKYEHHSLKPQVFLPLRNVSELVHHFITEHSVDISNLFNRYRNVHLYLEELFRECKIDHLGNVSHVEQLLISIQEKKLKEVLEIHVTERTGIQIYACLFCPAKYPYAQFLSHLYQIHSLNIYNTVLLSCLLDKLKKTLDELKCIYCERTFSCRDTLRRHMRKKKHFQIHKNNINYDEFYICNYKSREEVDHVIQETSDDTIDTDDYIEDITAHCLFCNMEDDLSLILKHMDIIHRFNFTKLRLKYKLDLYDQIKLLNYIRRLSIVECKCFACMTEFSDVNDLYQHFTECFRIGSDDLMNALTDEWRKVLYLFPTIEDDNLLLIVEDIDDIDFS